MFTVVARSEDFETKGVFYDKILISDALEQMGIVQHKPCGGKGICGKCKVIANGVEVCACKTYVQEDTYIKYTTFKSDVQVVTDSFVTDFEINPLVKEGLGMAVDIGTTTIAAVLYKFPGGEKLCSVSAPNNQAVYGADVISRIEYALKGGLEKLQGIVSGQIAQFSEKADSDIETYVITGNTAMLHLLTGKNPSGMATAPFVPESLFGCRMEKAYIPGCISAYVGADMTCAILSCGMLEDKVSFLVDIGTNGEMALWCNGKLVCCSTAAGPAFEGAGISCGMLAQAGAIDKVYIEDGEIKYSVLENKAPVGICGTGIIDALACMIKAGIIDETGYLEEDFQIGDSGICITAGDVRQIQLAKAAIRAGIDTLIHHCGINCDDIERFYIAGGFGKFINIDSACEIGLIPREISKKAIAAGNAALGGAEMILLSGECMKKSDEIADMAEVVDLTRGEYFMEKYMENMFF